jgi:hypothetical protein
MLYNAAEIFLLYRVAKVRAEYSPEVSLIQAVSVPVRYIVGVNLSSFISVKYIDFVQV